MVTTITAASGEPTARTPFLLWKRILVWIVALGVGVLDHQGSEGPMAAT